MSKIADYQGEGDPKDFAPDFEQQPEPYGDPLPELLEAFSTLPNGSTVLDIGGGYGRYAMPLAESGYDVTIVDTHQASLEEAKRRARLLKPGSGVINAVLGDVIREDLPLDTSFDAVTCIGFMHHLNDLGATALFETMADYTKLGGRVIVEYSTNKNRRMPSGEPILVDGAPEQNKSFEAGLSFLNGLFKTTGLATPELRRVPLVIRQPDFWYNADVIIASGYKSS